ncbi:peptidylprolyl isomerase [Paenibacillus sp. GYB003]|uniref:peptidylprolyl isomerase n=1 Tax=Paenibacillus sp. GYB003 TaxID=2994392 RepID=UPI002F96CD76
MKRQWHKSVCALAVATAVALSLAGCGSAPGKTGDKSWSAPPPMQLKADKAYEAVFDTTEGKFTVHLFKDLAPKTVNNFVFLSRQGYYDNVVFHRIMKTFMIQTGDPTGTGMGGPGYTIEDELTTKYKYDPGIVAMANTGAKNSGGSQFFICTGPDCAASLNKNPFYTIFGQVSSGMDVVQKIAATPVKQDARGEPSSPLKEVKINKIEIAEK